MRAAFYDFDGTLRPGDSIAAWLRYARRRGMISAGDFAGVLMYTVLARVSGRGMCEVKTRALRFERALTEEQLRALARDFTRDCLLPRLTKEGMASWERDGREGFTRVLVSASTSDYMPYLARALGADALICTVIGADGRVSENCRGPVKARRLREWRRSLPAADRPDWRRCRAYGDSAGDLDMLALCGEAHLIGNSQRAIKACESRGIRVIRGFSQTSGEE